MKVAIMGGGFTGITAAYYLVKKGYEVTIFEKEPVLGGLAVGFKGNGWEWPLERAYHHMFASDKDTLKLAEDIGFKDIFFRSPESASLFKIDGNYRTFPVDTPQDFLKLPILPFFDKIRSGIVVALLKLSPFLPFYERFTIEQFIRLTMGNRVWEAMWDVLLRKKFGKYAGKVLSSFFWARIKVRTKQLGYVKGGFQHFTEFIEKELVNQAVTIKKGTMVTKIEKKGEGFEITAGEAKPEFFDKIISTLPTALFARLTPNIFPSTYLDRFKKLEYLHAVVMILETKDKLFEKAYWTNVSTDDIPIMGIIQHTNFMDKEHYGGKEILYVANYVDNDNPLIKMTDKEIFDHYTKYLKQLNPKFNVAGSTFYVFKAPFAQPIFDKTFVENMPTFETPLKNFYIANLDMTYPQDRGTNYAVKVGKEVVEKYF